MRRFLRLVARVLSFPPLVGAAYVTLLVSLAARADSEQDQALGEGAGKRAVEAFVGGRYASEITRLSIALVLVSVALGIALGLVAALLLRLRFREPISPWRALLHALGLVAVLHGLLLARGMALAPQLYASTFYARGGVGRAFQVTVTDVLGPWGVLLLAVVLVVLYTRRAVTWFVPLALSTMFEKVRARPKTAGLACLPLLGIVPALGAASQKSQASATASAAAVGPSARPIANAATPAKGAVTAPRAPSGPRRNVLILAADSLRGDKLNATTMPALTKFAERAMVFDHAYVSLPRTFSSWVTLLTGRYAFHHGVRSMFPRWEDRQKDFDALPERFAAAGYHTAVVSDFAGDIFGRIDLGFQDVATPRFDLRELVRQRAVERETPLLPVLHSSFGREIFPVLKEMNHAADPEMLRVEVERRLASFGHEPFFLTVFFSTAHFPYAAPYPHYQDFTDAQYRGRYKYHKPVGLGEEAAPDEADVRQARALYDGAVKSIDGAAAEVLTQLERRGLLENTIVVVTADHGETLYENGHGQGHGDHLFGDEGTHTPLVIYDASTQHGHEDGIVRDVDLAPTLYDLAGLPPSPQSDGISLAPRLHGAPLEKRLAYAETELWFTEDITGLAPEDRLPYPGIMHLTELDAEHGDEIVLRKSWQPLTTMARHRMVRDDHYKLVYLPTRQGARYRLFDVTTDRAEVSDVAATHPKEVESMKALLTRWMLLDPNAELRDGLVVPRGGE